MTFLKLIDIFSIKRMSFIQNPGLPQWFSHFIHVFGSSFLLLFRCIGFHNSMFLRGRIFSPKHKPPPPTWRARSRYLYHPEVGWPSCIPRHWTLILVDFYDPYELRWSYSYFRPPHGKYVCVCVCIYIYISTHT